MCERECVCAKECGLERVWARERECVCERESVFE